MLNCLSLGTYQIDNFVEAINLVGPPCKILVPMKQRGDCEKVGKWQQVSVGGVGTVALNRKGQALASWSTGGEGGSKREIWLRQYHTYIPGGPR